MENQEAIVTVGKDGAVVIGTGVSVGQVLEALEIARRAVLGVVLRPEGAEATA